MPLDSKLKKMKTLPSKQVHFSRSLIKDIHNVSFGYDDDDDEPEFLEEQARKIREKELNRRYMEYIPQHDIELPKAPAFRTLEKRYVDTVVDRLTRPARERFNFKYPEHDVYNDWRKVERDRKQKLKDILDKLDGKTPKGKRKKKKMTEDSENAIIVNANPDEPDFVSSLPPIKD